VDIMTEVQLKPLVYLRPSSDNKFPAELCVQGSDEVFRVYAVSEGALHNMISEASDLLYEHRNKT
jgi:hypothetical protein